MIEPRIYTTLALFPTHKVLISSEEISVVNLFGKRTLKWNEIDRVSGEGNAIKLHNQKGDIVIAPSPYLPKYEEIIEWIGLKRPDLFSHQNHKILSKGFGRLRWYIFFAFTTIAFGVYVYLAYNFFLPLAVSVVIELVFAVISFSVPKFLIIQGDSVVLSYVSTKNILRASEIIAISLGFKESRNWKIYFIVLHLLSGNTIRIYHLDCMPVAYLVLKNWHKHYLPAH